MNESVNFFLQTVRELGPLINKNKALLEDSDQIELMELHNEIVQVWNLVCKVAPKVKEAIEEAEDVEEAELVMEF